MFAVKENKVYQITETEKQAYLKQGFDIVDADGKVIDHAPTKTITYEDHQKAIGALQKELEKAEKALAAAKKANA